MKTVRDRTGREWTIAVKVHDIARVQDLSGVDLTKILQGPVEDQLQDANTHWSMICALLQPQMDQRGLTPSQLGDALDGDLIEEIDLAVYEETIDFFPVQKRELLRKAFLKTVAAGKAVEKHVQAKIGMLLESLDFEKAVKAALDGKGFAGNSPESSEPTPAPEPSAS